jgi:mono/diheme cytochrome c family protein
MNQRGTTQVYVQSHELREAAMKTTSFGILLMTISLSLNTTAFAQKAKTDLGKAEFELHCAVCHGMDAKGNGIVGASLKVRPPDLTVLAKDNGGVFQAERIRSVIDGRTQVATHGPRDMPIWGRRYAINAAEHFVDAPYDQEAYVRARILLLVDYLGRIQQK